MVNIIKKAYLHPHDTYFEQVFKVREVALQLILKMLPPNQLEQLRLETLQLSTDSFINEEMKTSFSDLIYTCETHGGKTFRICLLFEHKSRSTGRQIYLQLGRYLIGVQSEDIAQKRRLFSLTIPIIFYHGKKPWNPKPLREMYGAVPSDFQGYIPHFDFLFVNLQVMKDEDIFAMEDTILLRNILLTMKHAYEDDFFRQHYEKVFTFADESMSEENLLSLFQSTFLYIQIVSSIKKEEIMQMVQTLPPQYERRAKSTYEQFVEEGIEQGIEKGIGLGIEKGIEKGIGLGIEKGIGLGIEKGIGLGIEQGIEQGIEKAIRNVIANRPSLSNHEIAEMLGAELSLVQKVRKSLTE